MAWLWVVGKVAGKLDKDLLEISTFIILVPYNIINWVHSHTGKIDQRARKKVHQVIRATFEEQV